MALEVATLTRCGVPEDLARRHLPHMSAAMRKYGITTRPRGRAFLATVLHESLGLRAMNEIGGGAKYQGRLGNTGAGDGQRYKGRGPIQLTGRTNYAEYGRKLGLNLVAHPELVARPDVGWRVAACFFQKCLPAADAGDFRRVTRLVNGGYNGWADRLRYWNKLGSLGVVPGSADLKRGAKGPKVEVLTRRLSFLRSKKTKKRYLDGARSTFDRQTVRALRRFQREHGLEVDGEFGPRSTAVLARAVEIEKKRRKKARASEPKEHPVTPTAPDPGTKHHAEAPSKGHGAKIRDGDRVERLWRRLERLDAASDRLRDELAHLAPTSSAAAAVPALAKTTAPPATDPGALSTPDLIQALERIDADEDGLRRALEGRLQSLDEQRAAIGKVQSPAAGSAELVELIEQLDHKADELRRALGDRLMSAEATLASQREVTKAQAAVAAAEGPPAAPTVAVGAATVADSPPTNGPPTLTPEGQIAELERLDQEADRLRAILEQRLIEAEQRTTAVAPTAPEAPVEPPAASALAAPDAERPNGPANNETGRYLAILARLDELDARADKVREALRRAGRTPAPAPHGHDAPAPAKSARAGTKARTFRLRSPEMKGHDVRGWQMQVNRQLKDLGVEYEVTVDSEYGKETARWSKRVLHALGLTSGEWHGVTPDLRIKVRHADRRTAAERAAARKRVPWVRKLRRRYDVPKGGIKAAVAYAKKHADRKTRETRTNGGPFIDDWCRGVHLQPGLMSSAWCGAFANACLVQGGIPSHDWVRYTPSIVNNAKAGVEGWSWHAKPNVGDLVLFNWPRGDFVDHVGIVVAKHPDGSITSVEGNFQNRVDYWRRKAMILGYARPPWGRH